MCASSRFAFSGENFVGVGDCLEPCMGHGTRKGPASCTIRMVRSYKVVISGLDIVFASGGRQVEYVKRSRTFEVNREGKCLFAGT